MGQGPGHPRPRRGLHRGRWAGRRIPLRSRRRTCRRGAASSPARWTAPRPRGRRCRRLRHRRRLGLRPRRPRGRGRGRAAGFASESVHSCPGGGRCGRTVPGALGSPQGSGGPPGMTRCPGLRARAVGDHPQMGGPGARGETHEGRAGSWGQRARVQNRAQRGRIQLVSNPRIHPRSSSRGSGSRGIASPGPPHEQQSWKGSKTSRETVIRRSPPTVEAQRLFHGRNVFFGFERARGASVSRVAPGHTSAPLPRNSKRTPKSASVGSRVPRPSRAPGPGSSPRGSPGGRRGRHPVCPVADPLPDRLRARARVAQPGTATPSPRSSSARSSRPAPCAPAARPVRPRRSPSRSGRPGSTPTRCRPGRAAPRGPLPTSSRSGPPPAKVQCVLCPTPLSCMKILVHHARAGTRRTPRLRPSARPQNTGAECP